MSLTKSELGDVTASNGPSITDMADATPLNGSVDASPKNEMVKNDKSENATEKDVSPAILPAPQNKNAVKPSDGDLDQSFKTYQQDFNFDKNEEANKKA